MILIEGAPGIGKTIMAKEIAIQWANKNILKNKKMLFLLYLRDPKVKTITDVHSLVKIFCQSDTLTCKITDWLITTSGEYLAIVLDGYDEMSAENKSHCIIDSIINREILPKCAGIITSRPAASLCLHDKVTCRAEILGFSIEDRQGFIHNALKGQNNKIMRLKGFLQSNPLLNALCYIPLNMSILLCLTTEGIDALPKTQTNLYQKFVLMTIFHFLKKDKIKFETSISNLDDFSHPYDQVIKELSQFAFLAVQKDQLVFTKAEVKAECPNVTPANWYGLGLLKPAQYFKAQDGCHESFHFLHYSIQEYMAAYYIASLPNNELLSLLKETFWNVRYYNTWVMYVGITGGKNFMFVYFLSGNYLQIWTRWLGAKTISSTILKDKIKRLHLLQCSAETDHEMLSSVETIFQEDIIDLSNQFLSVNDVRILANLLLKLPRKKWNELNLSGCSINDEGCKLLCEPFLSNSIALEITAVDISDNRFNWESLKQLCKIFKLWKVNKIIMSIETPYDSTTMNLIKQFKSKLNNNMSTIGRWFPWPPRENLLLTYLPQDNKMIAVFACSCTFSCRIINNCQLDDDYLVEHLLSFIQHSRHEDKLPWVTVNYHIPGDLNKKLSTMSCHFHQITFKGSYMHSKGIFKLQDFSEALMYTDKRFNNLVADFIMATIVHSNSQPSKPYLETIPVFFAESLKECLQDYSGILHICASESNLDSEVASDIATVLSCSPNLKKLCFGSNNLRSTGAIRIARALQNVSTLTSIILGNNNIDTEAADDIASVLSHNTALKILKLSRNNFQTTGAIKIAKALQNTFTLTTFEIADNYINKEAANDIATVLSHNTKLEELDLSRNNLQAVGAMKIAQALQNTFTLTTFGIAGNNTGEEAADDIATALSHNVKLHKLFLSDNNLQSVGTIMITKVLENNLSTCTLTNIDISNNNIGMEESAAVNIATVLIQCHNLMELKLSRNNLQAMGAIEIVRSLQELSWLKVINFSDNNISEEAAEDIAAALSNKKILTHLDLSVNNFQTAGIIKISRALKNISNLQELNISRNNIGEEAAVDIATVLSHNNNLQNLDLHHNQLQATGVIIIAKELLINKTLKVFNISENNISKEAIDHVTDILSCIMNLDIIASDILPTNS